MFERREYVSVVNSHYQLLVDNFYACKHVVAVRDEIPRYDAVTRNKQHSDLHISVDRKCYKCIIHLMS